MEGESVNKVKARHKNELKEWQKKKQSLVKNAKKNKEALAEIEAQEKQLLDRHTAELDQAKKNKDESEKEFREPQESAPEPVEEPSLGTKQKNQKRREKREQKLRERDDAADTSAYDEAQKSGARAEERRQIEAKLAQLQLTIKDMPSQGSCLFDSLSDQLYFVGYFDDNNVADADLPVGMVVKKGDSLNGSQLREVAASWMRRHRDELIVFATDEQTGDAMTEAQYESHCDKIEKTNEWGGHLEIVAIARSLGCDVVVVSADAPDVLIEGCETKGRDKNKKTLRVTYHKREYGLGDHYNSVMKSK